MSLGVLEALHDKIDFFPRHLIPLWPILKSERIWRRQSSYC